MSTDSQLIARSMTEPASFGEIFHRHAAAIHRYVARRAGPDVADDVTSATFLTAFERRSRFDTARDDAGPWLYGIATNLLHRHRIAEARTLRSLERNAAEAAAQPLSDDLAEAAETRLEVRRLARELRRLSVPDRDCLLLYAWQGLSYAEIAEAMSVPVGTVRSRLNRARRILRASPNAPESAYPAGSAAETTPEGTSTANAASPLKTRPTGPQAPHPDDTTIPIPICISVGTAHFKETTS